MTQKPLDLEHIKAKGWPMQSDTDALIAEVERLRTGLSAMADFAEADRDSNRESLRVIAARARALLGKE